MRLSGWKWEPDKKRDVKTVSVYRWPDGVHYYVRKPDGDPLDGKWDTYEGAWKAWERWQESQK